MVIQVLSDIAAIAPMVVMVCSIVAAIQELEARLAAIESN